MVRNSADKMEDKTVIQLEHISKKYDETVILKDISFTIQAGEFVSIVGPSGCGKSTLLNIITKLTTIDNGTLQINGKIGYMQQKDLLLPWKSVLDNIVLPHDLQGENKKESRQNVQKYIEMVGLQGYENKYPYELSGGMKQRANFLRTFLTSDEIMLLDEPFGALDSITKGKMQDWLLEMKNQLNITILFITHDIEEAIFLSDRIYVLSEKPSTIKKEIPLDFYKEDKRKRMLSREFLEWKNTIVNLL